MIQAMIAAPAGTITYSYDAADQMTNAVGVTYGYDENGNQTSRGSDTFTYDHENCLTQAVMNGVTFSSLYNGDGLRMSHTEGVVTTSYTWDVVAGLPVVIQDDDNTYVYGLDLISATDGAGVQTYHLYDGLGSTTDLTDASANPTDAYSYDVFGTVRSQSGSSPNDWLFTGEQRDGQPGTSGGVQRLPLDVVVSSSNLTGATVANLDDDPDAPDGAWATATTVADTAIRTGFPTPPSDPTPGADLQEFRVLLRKNASGGNDPTYDIELWESGGGSPLATLISGATLSSDTGVIVSATWDASLLGTADGSAVEVRIVGHRSGGSPNSRRTVEVGAIEWNADFQGTPSSELYYLRARYYEPETGRFLGRDPLPAGNRYPYVLNNPVNFTDPSGLHCKAWHPHHCAKEKVIDPVVDAGEDAVEGLVDTLTDPDVWKPLAGAGLIIVADLPVLIGEPLCVLTVWTGFTCVAVQWYAVFVATPATYVGLCIIGKSNFFDIPGLDGICGEPNTASAAGLSNNGPNSGSSGKE